MISSVIRKLKNIILKDTGHRNESPKLVGNVRLLLIFLIINNTINTLIYKNFVNLALLAHFALFSIVFIALLVLSYRIESKATIILTNLSILLWIYLCITQLGWGTGIQSYILILLILCYFTGHTNNIIKYFYTVFLIGFRVYLYIYCSSNTVALSLEDGRYHALPQIANTIIIFIMVSFIMNIFSSDSQTLENKLIDYNNQLMAQANTDALTKLYNRRKGREYMEQLLSNPPEHGFSVCICDIDFFKKVNDNYGHDVGDSVLLSLASTLKSETQDDGFVARWGGEEFLIVYPDCNGDEALIKLESLRQKVKDIKITVGSKVLSITVTFGLAEYDFSGDIDSILKEADNKLYIGKESGRDRIIF